MFKKPDQPFMAQRIEESLNVRVQYPVHAPPRYAHTQRIERLMSMPPGTKTIAESSKVHLVYFIQDGHHGLLDDLILQRRDADWPLPTIRFR